jgi:hypothetical protein
MLPPKVLHYNKPKIRRPISPQKAEQKFLTAPWPLINSITLKFLVSGIHRGAKEPLTQITSMQKNYVRKTQQFLDWAEFEADPANFFRNLALTQKFHFFGDFHSRLHATSVSESSAERKIKHSKRLVSKYQHKTKHETLTLYMKASSRKNLYLND